MGDWRTSDWSGAFGVGVGVGLTPSGTMSEDPKEDMRCQMIFYHTLTMTDASLKFLRELNCTERCDMYHDLSKLRLAYRVYVGDDVMERILHYKQSDEDKQRGEQAVEHYKAWSEESLEGGLSWSKWAWYHSVHRAERSIAILGIGAIVRSLTKSVHIPAAKKWFQSVVDEPRK